jgi:NAD-dependent deacetylase
MNSPDDLKSRVDELMAMLRDATCGVALTGAGISTESGIPDFRSPGGLWSKNMPIPFGDFLASAEMRAEAWRRKFALDDATRGAAPNVTHRALARFAEQGNLSLIVTQNIDGLHGAAGTPPDRLVEIHGNGTFATCLSCGQRYELGWVRERFERSGSAPDCEECGGPVKSATISFGQAMPAEAMRRAERAATQADVFLALGSSLVVYPAAALPVVAKRNGATLVIVNREPTEMDELADLVIRANLGRVFEAFPQHS